MKRTPNELDGIDADGMPYYHDDGSLIDPNPHLEAAIAARDRARKATKERPMPSYGNIPMRNPTGFVEDDEVQPANSVRTQPKWGVGGYGSTPERVAADVGYGSDPRAMAFLEERARAAGLRDNHLPSGPGNFRQAPAGAPLYDANEQALPRLATGDAVGHFNRYTGGNVTRTTQAPQASQSLMAPQKRIMDANVDDGGQRVSPRIGAPGDYDLAAELTPEAMPQLDRLAKSKVIRGRNETTGQDFEYTPRKSVRPDVAIAIIQEARRKQRMSEVDTRDDKRFGREVELAKIPGAQRIAEIQAQQNSPLSREMAEDRRFDREDRREEQAYRRTQRAQELTPSQQRTRERLQYQIERGTPQQRRQAQMQMDRLEGVQNFGDDGAGYGASTLEDEGNYRKLLAPQVESVGRAFDSGWYTSGSERKKQEIAIKALRTAAARGQIPNEVVDEIIAEAQTRH